MIPDRLPAPDLILREPLPEDRIAVPDAFQGFDDLRVIVVRSSGREAGHVGRTGAESRIELQPDHRRRGRGTEAMSVWLDALVQAALPVALPDVDHPAARAFYRDFGLLRAADGHWVPSPRTAERLADFRSARSRRYRQRVHMGLLELGVPGDYGHGFGLPLTAEASGLLSIGKDIHDRPQFLAPDAADAWRRLVGAAADDGVVIQPVSAFRGFDDQLRIIQRKRARGDTLAEIAAVSALPGYSEHHSGGAIDVTTPGAAILEESFEDSDAYRWLVQRAGEFGFRQTYPRGNSHGIAFEPWHWCHAATAELAIAALA